MHPTNEKMTPESIGKPGPPELRLIAWETTRSCNLSCIHCRAAAEKGPYRHSCLFQQTGYHPDRRRADAA